MSEPFCAVLMPKWGIEMQQGTIADWHVSVGQQVAKGDLLVDVETDKIVNTVEAPAAGVLHRVLVGKGDVLPVGALLAVIGAAQARGSDIDRFIADLGVLR